MILLFRVQSDIGVKSMQGRVTNCVSIVVRRCDQRVNRCHSMCDIVYEESGIASNLTRVTDKET